MDNLMAHLKLYVDVIAKTDRFGDIEPKAVIWEDGTVYEIDRIIEKRRAYSKKTGAGGVRYTVRVEGQQTHLYFEGPRWFVEKKIPYDPIRM